MIYQAPLQILLRTQVLDQNLEEAWDFFSRPENLAMITPPDLGLEVTSSIPEKIYAGMIITYKVRPFLRTALPWVTEITHVREPNFFVDEQRSGPYRFWHHQHIFEKVETGVRITDLVHYQVSFGRAGHCLVGRFIRQRLDNIFNYRRQILAEKFG